MINAYEDFQKAGREGINRSLQSFAALSSGLQGLAAETAGFSRTSVEEGASHFQKLLGTRSLESAMTAQADFIKAQYERAVGEGARFGELYLGVVKDVMKPFEDFVPSVKK